MGYRTQRRFKQDQRDAYAAHLDPQEPMTDDEFEIEYSEYAWDRIDAEASGKRIGEWHR